MQPTITIAKAMSGQKSAPFFEGETVLQALSYAYGEEVALDELEVNKILRRAAGQGQESSAVPGDYVLSEGDSLFISEKHDNG